MAKYAKTPTTTDTFDKTGDSEAEVVNTSGQPSPNMQTAPRGSHPAPYVSPRTVSHRVPVEIDAETGQRLADSTEKALTAAAQRRISVRETVDASHPSIRLSHLFGLNLPGRDRA